MGKSVFISLYCSNLVYNDDRLSTILFDGGYASVDEGGGIVMHFYVKDHLGSNRLVVDGNGNIEEVNHYYPFGALMGDRCGVSRNKYKYIGKELDTMYGWNMQDHEARWYDPVMGRWVATDPLQEKYASVSSYCYTANNPIRFIDTDGKAIVKGVVAAFKYAKRIWKVYKKTGKLTSSNLKKAGLSEFLDIAGDIQTIFDGDATFIDKIGATADLMVGTDFNTKGQKKVQQALESTFGKEKGSLSETKKVLENVKEKLGLDKTETLPKQKGKFGSPSRGNSKKGYRLDPAHPNAKPGRRRISTYKLLGFHKRQTK